MIKYIFLVTILMTILIACSKDKDSAQVSASYGEKLFQQKHIGKNKSIGCIMCHSLSNEKTVGPSLKYISKRAALIHPNMSAREYIYQSITEPDAYIVAGYIPGLMYSFYKQELTELEINSLVEFLLLQ